MSDSSKPQIPPNESSAPGPPPSDPSSPTLNYWTPAPAKHPRNIVMLCFVLIPILIGAALVIVLVRAVHDIGDPAWYQRTTNEYRAFARPIVQKPIRQIEFEPHAGWRVALTDTGDIEAVRQWLANAFFPVIAGWGPADCDMTIHFSDGSVEKMKIGLTWDPAMDQASTEPRHQPSDYAMISWGGYYVMGENQPFSNIVRRLKGLPMKAVERAAPSSKPATLSPASATTDPS